MKVRILDEAERDILDGFRFYEAQQVGLGDYFLDRSEENLPAREPILE